MRDNKTEYHDRFRDYGVGEKVFRTFVTKADAAATTATSTAAATVTTTGSGSSGEQGDLLSKDKDKDENLIDERAKVKEKSRGGGKGGGRNNGGGCGGRMAGMKRRGNEGSKAKAAEVTVAAAKATEASATGKATEATAASPVSLEGNPRTQYLKERNIKAPDEKFLFTVTEQVRIRGPWGLAWFGLL